ncbi:Imm1 family immunity protein [Micromonospora sp. Llam0]|uniref:Imm1 family immunity protein n=1 Tax=Micromonospora sp. Llam0 TaxID=2485143 RepID=UPI001F441412|nr:Imm1 family immunity protein [Micromonospora sp. Llam0]
MMMDYHGHREPLPDPGRAAESFADQAESIMAHGGTGQTIWIGPMGGPAQLRIDIDTRVNRAAVCWLPDGTRGIEREPGGPITVVESPDSGLVTVPAILARASVAAAGRAVAEYAATGRRPTCLTWQSEHQ